jgi:hypothetical protein
LDAKDLSASRNQISYGKIILFLFCTFLGAATFGTIIHEGGHCLSAVALGGHVAMIVVFPGVELYPEIKLDLRRHWPVIGGCDYDGIDSRAGRGFILFMGSGSNLIVAYIVLIVAAFIKPRWLCIMLILQAIVYGWDIITYSTLPLFGIPHHVIIGGRDPEPLLGATRMGCPKIVYFALLFLHFALFHFVLTSVVLKRRLHRSVKSNIGVECTR